MPSPTTTTAPYAPRHCTFKPNSHLVDEKIIDHDHHIKPHFIERTKISHRDLGSLSLLANLTRVQWGYFKDSPAALITFRFQFQGGHSLHSWRFEKADVRINFRAHPPSSDPSEDPVVVDFGPKHLVSNGTDESRTWWYTATLSARTSTALPVSIDSSPSLSLGHSTSYPKHTAVAIEGADFSDHDHTEPNIVKFWLREDEKQKSRVPLDFDCAVIVKYPGGSFEATVDVKVGPVFDLLATPWMAEDPVIFEPGMDYGEGVREGQVVDFSTLTVEEWRKMVTPDLKFSEALNDQQHKTQ